LSLSDSVRLYSSVILMYLPTHLPEKLNILYMSEFSGCGQLTVVYFAVYAAENDAELTVVCAVVCNMLRGVQYVRS